MLMATKYHTPKKTIPAGAKVTLNLLGVVDPVSMPKLLRVRHLSVGKCKQDALLDDVLENLSLAAARFGFSIIM